MTEPDINEVVAEAKKFRLKLELSKNANIRFVAEDFPVMSCKLSSLLFTYHALQKWPSIIIHGVSGRASNHDRDDVISHYWLEYQEIAIDLTADQYNIIEEKYLNKQIIQSRPFKPVSTGRVGSMQNYKLFHIAYRDTYISGLPELAEDFLDDLYASYEALNGLALRT
ncbi:hypothetical protein [Stutzerimonas nitrititolerans]|uniref:hypothetical protein n=1 Tax=Stutzerimonas nitrititolerans TaxID=2482751 RepID=UPI0028B1483B|nr:hypothetical protein [Stutzerimonas nitrititolerans]